VTPFAIKKRVVLQEAYDGGRSVFSYIPPTSTKVDDANELKQIYTNLVHFVTKHITHT
jgi:hypothetical protein